jgi:uncharacterized membrane protein YccC
MEGKHLPTVVTGALIIIIAVVFRNVLHKSPDVVPLYLVPIFFYIGYLTGKSPKAWMGITIAITASLAILYALS